MIQIWIKYTTYKRVFVILNKSVINYLPTCASAYLTTKALMFSLCRSVPIVIAVYDLDLYCVVRNQLKDPDVGAVKYMS